MRPIRLAFLGLALLLATPCAALACGQWDIKDRQAHLNVGFWIENIVIKATRKPAEYIYLKAEKLQDLRAEDTHGRTMLSFSTPPEQPQGELRLYKSKAGTYDGDRLRLRNGREFQIAITLNPAYRDKHDVPVKWIVDVKEGDSVVAHDIAMAMCLHGIDESTYDTPERNEAERTEIRRRVMIYLAWRELVRGR